MRVGIGIELGTACEGIAVLSGVGRFETAMLTLSENLAALADLPGRRIDTVHDHRPPKVVTLDMDSSERGEGDRLIKSIKRSDAAWGLAALPRPWAVEGTFLWLGRCRPLAKDWEAFIPSAEAWLLIANIRFPIRRLPGLHTGSIEL